MEALDRLELGVVLLGRTGEVLAANRTARAIAAENDGLCLGEGGVSAVRPKDTKRLQRAAHDAIATALDSQDGLGEALLLDRVGCNKWAER